ncbi:hypothetical protein ACWD5R_28900 [Streptomyces sp. NPDC002514]|uniref:hypothetical protein n=1 Tax=unclassified Streptomyces TaxID=2593676 RepID=UPI00368A719A
MNLSDSRTGGPGPWRVGATEAAPGHLRGAVERDGIECGVIERAVHATGEASRPALRAAPRTTGPTVTRTAKGTFVVEA